jgi:hypothetical protein
MPDACKLATSALHAKVKHVCDALQCKRASGLPKDSAGGSVATVGCVGHPRELKAAEANAVETCS